MADDEREIPARLTVPHLDSPVQERGQDGQMAAEMPPLCGDDAITVECTGDPKPTDRILHSTHFDNRQFSRAIRDVTVPNPRTESNAA